jgi:hypothetical protein
VLSPLVIGPLCRRQIRSLDAWVVAGAALRAHVPLVEEEEAGVFHMAAEGKHGRSPGLQRVRAANGDILTSEAAVQDEVFSFFSAIFQGRHVAAADPAGDPVDGGVPFSPDHLAFPQFLDNLLQLSPEERDGLEVPFSLTELEAAVLEAAPNKAPGLDGLSYKFYRATLPIIGPHLLAALSSMLSSGLLSVSLRVVLCVCSPRFPPFLLLSNFVLLPSFLLSITS